MTYFSEYTLIQKTSKPTKPANNGILLYSLSSLPTLWDRYVSYPHTRKTDSKG